MAHFKLIPHTPYYGTADATILYLIVLHNAWRCTADPDLLARYMPVAEKCLTWIDKYGDRDGDGFQEYQTRSKAGAYNQGWKDSPLLILVESDLDGNPLDDAGEVSGRVVGRQECKLSTAGGRQAIDVSGELHTLDAIDGYPLTRS